MTVEFILLLLGGYLMGSIPTAYLAARWRHKLDLRQHGSGNVGAANLVKFGSKRLGVATIIFDIAKVMVAVGVAKILGLDIAQQTAIGIAGIVGHNWSVFLRFHGGRGIAATIGVAFIVPVVNWMVPWSLVAFLVIMLTNLATLRTIPLGIAVAVAAMPITSWAVGEPIELTLGFVAIFLIMLIRRLLTSRTQASASVPTGELLLNRLLFDRDIRDREAWVNQKRVKPKKEKKD